MTGERMTVILCTVFACLQGEPSCQVRKSGKLALQLRQLTTMCQA